MKKKKPVIEILIVGDEILSNPACDKNSQYLVDTLSGGGFGVNFIEYVGDVIADIVGAFQQSVKRADIILVTGGLGPTSDDMTVEAAAKAFGLNLILDEKALKWIEDIFRRRNRLMSDSNRKQALVPEGSIPFRNEKGTAPGIFIEVEKTDIYLMPGVPGEMSAMFNSFVFPRIKDSFETSPINVASLNITGITESELYDRIIGIPGVKDAVRYYPGYEGITVKIITDEGSPVDADSLKVKIQSTLGDLVYSTENESLEQVVGKMLSDKGLTIAVAESCTGGLVAHRLTNVPGSSDYLLCGVVAYSNESKQRILGVDRGLIETYGAVSAEVAQAMSEGVRRISGADIGISATGIAGPSGGSEKKPVGLMFSGISSENRTETKKLQFVEDRIINKSRMSQAVLDIIRNYLKEEQQKL